jgi:hypothetical protein
MGGVTMRKPSLLFLAASLLIGCGGPKITTVTGTVTLNGQPLANALVNFQPLGEGKVEPGPGSTGRTNEKGEYALKIIGGGNGAVVGKHRVAIYAALDDGKTRPNEDRRTRQPERVPAQYNVKSTLTFEVKPGKNVADFSL